jgi:hypothetical protein
MMTEAIGTVDGTTVGFRRIGRAGLTSPLARCVAGAVLVLVLAGSGPLVLVLAGTALVWAWARWRGGPFGLRPWLAHLLLMAAAMYAGMLAYMAVLRPLALAAVGPAFAGGPSYVGMVIAMLVPMVALMALEGHDRRMWVEMALAMVVPIGACFALLGSGICPLVPALSWLTAASVYGAAHDAMLLGMVGDMGYRRGMYA